MQPQNANGLIGALFSQSMVIPVGYDYIENQALDWSVPTLLNVTNLLISIFFL